MPANAHDFMSLLRVRCCPWESFSSPSPSSHFIVCHIKHRRGVRAGEEEISRHLSPPAGLTDNVPSPPLSRPCCPANGALSGCRRRGKGLNSFISSVFFTTTDGRRMGMKIVVGWGVKWKIHNHNQTFGGGGG